MSTLGGGPGNLDLVKFADQVPAKPPGSMSAALTVSETATREKAKTMSLVCMDDMIIQIDMVSILFLSHKNGKQGPGGGCRNFPNAASEWFRFERRFSPGALHVGGILLAFACCMIRPQEKTLLCHAAVACWSWQSRCLHRPRE